MEEPLPSMRVVGSEKTGAPMTTYFRKPVPKNASGKNLTPPMTITYNNRPGALVIILQ